MAKITLNYGMKVAMTVDTIAYNFFGFGVTSSTTQEKTEFTIEKYWEDDTDPHAYKVKLVPLDKSGKFGIEKMYGSDLISCINRGSVEIVS